MTTTLVPPESSASAARALRIPPFSANLLPVEIVEARRVRKVKRVVVSALAGFVAVLVAWYAVAYYQTSAARSNLHEAESRTGTLRQQQKAFDELVKAQAESKAINTELSVLLGNDLQWAGLIAATRGAAPSGVQITGVAGTVAGTGVRTAQGAGATLPNSVPDKLVGTLTVTGTGTTKAVVASYIDAVAKVTGLANPMLSSAVQLGCGRPAAS
jgi:hypothetical protein